MSGARASALRFEVPSGGTEIHYEIGAFLARPQNPRSAMNDLSDFEGEAERERRIVDLRVGKSVVGCVTVS